MKKLIIAIIVIAIVVIGVIALSGDKSDSLMSDKDAMMKDDSMNDAMVDDASDDSMMNDVMFNAKVLSGKSALYLEFSQEDYNLALKENKIILLNFYANWCPFCIDEEPEVFAAYNELENANIVGFRVNYKDSDTDKDEEELAKEFGIPYQHTKVIIKDGKQILKSPETWSKERYLEELSNL